MAVGVLVKRNGVLKAARRVEGELLAVDPLTKVRVCMGDEEKGKPLFVLLPARELEKIVTEGERQKIAPGHEEDPESWGQTLVRIMEECGNIVNGEPKR